MFVPVTQLFLKLPDIASDLSILHDALNHPMIKLVRKSEDDVLFVHHIARSGVIA